MDVEVIVEIPRGSRNKYEMDHRTGRIRLDRMLFASAGYPLDCGFMPGTAAGNGEPLDALAWLGAPAFPGCRLTARPVALLWMAGEHGTDVKVLTVCAGDPRMDRVRDLADVPAGLTAEIGHFFRLCQRIESGRRAGITGWQDRHAAERVIAQARARAREQAGAGAGPLRGERTPA
jgi:inorganic pyrophosphatase